MTSIHSRAAKVCFVFTSDSLSRFVFVDSSKKVIDSSKKVKKEKPPKKSSSKSKSDKAKKGKGKDKKKKKQKVKIKSIPSSENWKYLGSLVGFAVIGSLLRRSAVAQLVFTGTFWLYLLWISIRIEKMFLGTSFS